MKKTLIILLSLFPIVSFANWDAVRTLNYGANFNSPFNVNIEVINDACGTKSNYGGDISRLLTVNGNNGTTCSLSSGKIKCTLSKGNTNDRTNTISSGLSLTGNRYNILNSIGVDSKISSNFNSRYTHKIVSDFGLMTDSNANDRFPAIEYSLNTGTKNLFNCGNTINYFDNTECKDKYKKYEDVEVTNGSGVVSIEKRELPFEEVFYINTSTSCSSTVVNYSNPVVPPILSNEISIEGCEKKGNVVYCMSDAEKFKLNFKITSGGTHNGINYINANINNENNTSSVLKNSASTTYGVGSNTIEVNIPKEKGTYTLEFSGYGKNGDGQTLSNLLVQKIVVIPNNDFKFSTGDLEKVTGSNVYANNSDIYKYCKNITDSNGNTLNDLSRILNTTIKSGYKTNRINNSGDQALIIKSSTFDKDNSKGCVEFSGLAPYEGAVSFDFKLAKHDIFYENLISDYKDLGYKIINDVKFIKPFTGKISASRDDNNYNYNPEIGTLMKYRFEAVNSTNNISTSNFKFSYSSDSNIVLIGENLEKQDFQVTDLEGKESFFEGRINYVGTEVVSTIKPSLKVENAIVEYNIDGKIVKYYISELVSPNDRTPVLIEFDEGKVNNSFIGVKIIGGVKGEGNQDITGQDLNISELNSYEVRTKIRKNAYDFTKSLTTGSTINGVHYVDGNYTLNNSSPNFETLVVKNGNLTIATNINKQKFGIIVLSDGYNVANGKDNKGNIFIKPNVTKVNGLLYADGGVMSVGSDNKLLSTDSFSRTETLQKQLYIKGSIITRNTIGGAILTDNGNYILPGKQTTNDFNLAMIFDLNYLRRGDIGSSDENKGYSTVIEYNPGLVLDAPKLFNN